MKVHILVIIVIVWFLSSLQSGVSKNLAEEVEANHILFLTIERQQKMIDTLTTHISNSK